MSHRKQHKEKRKDNGMGIVRFLAHILNGIWSAVSHSFQGFVRPRQNDKEYYMKPFSVWKGILYGHILDLVEKATPQTITGFLWDPLPGTDGDLNPKDIIQSMGISNEILHNACIETRSRITNELKSLMTVCSFVAGFAFAVLLQGVSDGFGFLIGFSFVMTMLAMGMYARLIAVFNWSSTTKTLYKNIVRWESAMSANQLMFLLVIVCNISAALVAVFHNYSLLVFLCLLVIATVALVMYIYFWADSLWCFDDGVYVSNARVFYKYFVGIPFDCDGKKYDRYIPVVGEDNATKTLFYHIDYVLSNHFLLLYDGNAVG